jgi:hypothetical protein
MLPVIDFTKIVLSFVRSKQISMRPGSFEADFVSGNFVDE